MGWGIIVSARSRSPSINSLDDVVVVVLKCMRIFKIYGSLNRCLKLAGTVIECLDESIVQHEGEPPSKAMSPSRVAYTNLVYIVHEHKEGITAFQNQIGTYFVYIP
eukprot:576407-Amorphochlora_amoeboformis.AAC.2